MRWLSGDKRAERIERRGEKRSARISERADRGREERIRDAHNGWTGRPLFTRTWVSGRRRG